jgi:hypothetical protein
MTVREEKRGEKGAEGNLRKPEKERLRVRDYEP